MATDPIVDVAAGAIPYDVVTITALAAGEIREIRGPLSFVSLLTATNTNKVSISFNGSSFFAFTDGITISEFVANGFWCRNDEAAATNTLVFARGQGYMRDNRLILSALSALPVAATFAAGAVAAGAYLTGAIVDLGLKADTAATTDAGTFSLIALFKRLLGKLYTKASTLYTVDSLASTNAVSITAVATQVLSISITNTTGATKYVRLYDKASAPSVGTDVAFRTIAVPATSSKEISYPAGDTYLLGLGIAITGAAAYNDSTAVAAHDVQLSINYQ